MSCSLHEYEVVPVLFIEICRKGNDQGGGPLQIITFRSMRLVLVFDVQFVMIRSELCSVRKRDDFTPGRLGFNAHIGRLDGVCCGPANGSLSQKINEWCTQGCVWKPDIFVWTDGHARTASKNGTVTAPPQGGVGFTRPVKKQDAFFRIIVLQGQYIRRLSDLSVRPLREAVHNNPAVFITCCGPVIGASPQAFFENGDGVLCNPNFFFRYPFPQRWNPSEEPVTVNGAERDGDRKWLCKINGAQIVVRVDNEYRIK